LIPDLLTRGITGVVQHIGLLAQIHAAAVDTCGSGCACLVSKRWNTPGYSRAERDVEHVKEDVMQQYGEQFVDVG
jgi:hypothetical protein